MAENREQRRTRERAERRLPVDDRGRKLLEGAAVFEETLNVNRFDAVQRVVQELFEHDEVGKLFRLKGLGGATGVITEDNLAKAANSAISAALLLPRELIGDGEPEAPAPATDEVMHFYGAEEDEQDGTSDDA